MLRWPTISSLGGTTRPDAVLLAVWAIVVDALNSVFSCWTRPHVSEEGLERMPPFVRDVDATAAVVFPVSGLLITAALLQIAPRAPFRRDSIPSHAMLRPVSSRDFYAQTPATLAAAIAQGWAVDEFHSSAIATAEPASLGLASLDHNPAAKSPSLKFYKVWHDAAKHNTPEVA